MNREIVGLCIGMIGMAILGIFITSYIQFPYSILGLPIIAVSSLVFLYNLILRPQFETEETNAQEGKRQ